VLKAPILDWQPPHDMYTLKAKDVMNKPPVCFFLTERVGDVFQVNPILFLSVCLSVCVDNSPVFDMTDAGRGDAQRLPDRQLQGPARGDHPSLPDLRPAPPPRILQCAWHSYPFIFNSFLFAILIHQLMNY
jgi:hypothetical protein